MRIDRLRGLYAVTPNEADTARLCAMVGAAIDGGATAIQYRNKAVTPASQREQALALARLCRQRGALFIVNDDAALASEVDADGVHIGEDDGAIAQARSQVKDGRIVGVSCYDDLARAQALASSGADYIAFGSFFPSRVKPAARRADVSLVRAAKSLGVPVVAIGGITAENAPLLVDAGIDAVAVISDVFAHDDLADITRAAARIAACFESP
jgi:thiamine-phosphate pyrophosphorylase